MSGKSVHDVHDFVAHKSITDAERGDVKLETAGSPQSLELQNSRGDSSHSSTDRTASNDHLSEHHVYEEYLSSPRKFWNRLRGKGKKKVGWWESLRNVVIASWLNILFVFIPIAWASHFVNADKTQPHQWPHQVTFALCFVSIIPMENIFDWGGEQMSIYLGKDLGDLVIISLNNAVEAALAIILLIKCELRLLQSTIVGVVVLHLLLIPGTAFLAGGAQIWEQNLHPHPTQLNHSLLAIGVLTILLPTAWFAALDRGAQSISTTGTLDYSGNLLTDVTREQLLRMSRGLAVILLLVYIGSRIFLHDPPGEDNALQMAPNAPKELREQEEHLKSLQPEINPWACMLMLAVTVAIMATTAEFLVESIEDVRESGGIQEEWFGLILLPIVSFAGDGCIAIAFFLHRVFHHFFGGKPMEASELAKARAIDLSIQFTLFWMPFLVLLGWWINKPLHLMFDFFELALLLGSSFLVNYVTADAKTNWVEGLILVAFYFMIAICAWFYEGQPELALMLNCPDSVAAALIGESAGESTPEIVARFIAARL